MNELRDLFQNKNILVLGGCGSIGSKIAEKLLDYKPKAVRVLDNNETGLFDLNQKIKSDKIRLLIGDIRDKERLEKATENIDIIYHAAALKHVPLCEYNPFEAIKTNVIGTQNVIEAALYNNVSKVIYISTDKAVNPVNTMGASKLLSEKLIIDANMHKGLKTTIFCCVRFGNVLYSRGSVVPVFQEQARKKEPITITNEKMTRFMISMEQAINLVFKASLITRGGEVFILKMPVVKLKDLADVIIEQYSDSDKKIKKQYIGMRPGEKMHEELMTKTEEDMGFETEDMYIIPPQVQLEEISHKISDYKNIKISKIKNYSSKKVTPISKEEIKKILKKN